MRPSTLTIAFAALFISTLAASAHTFRINANESTTPQYTSQAAPANRDGWVELKPPRGVFTLYLLVFDTASALILLVLCVLKCFGY